ncbi:MAG TPA: NADH-quinone oxidoreductase subunit J [Candidatus Paceibacterota bacterium]|nr:NADH-quinone oxidoreductase subunit J [Verrucomicrobiota bacterium]HRY50926.1 NADH-quinone oxidoreductase subunit J [Candidatus Paceibacterota bacterium]
MMSDLLFYLLAGLAVVSGFLVVLNPLSRSPVTSAMFLVATMVCLAGLFLLLHAYFLAAVQILIYAGAVMVLFLFVIMMLDLKEEQRQRFSRWRVPLAVGAALFFLAGLAGPLGRAKALSAATGTAVEGHTAPLGQLLLSTYVLPFEVVSAILLVAMVGVVLLSKKESK